MQPESPTGITKPGTAANGAGQPSRPDWTLARGWDLYTPGEHAVWNPLFNRQAKLLPSRACDEFVEGMRALPIGPEQIPDFRRLSEVLMRTLCRIDDLQETYFVLDDFDQLLRLAEIDFGEIYAQVRKERGLEPGETPPDDRVILRGTGRYHDMKRQEKTK